jgi:hypothetical protein
MTVAVRKVKAARALAVLATLVCAAPALGQSTAASAVSLYLDDDATRVITSVTRGSFRVWEGGDLSASYLVDVISSASVDVVSQATPGFEENRHGITAALSQAVGDHLLRANYGFSVELGTGPRAQRPAERVADYVGHGLGVGADFSFFQQNTTLSADYSLELGQVGRADDTIFEEALTTHAADVRLSQVLSKSLVGTLGWTLTVQRGYTAKPYRFARVGEVTDGVCRACPPERHPRTRLRNAVFLVGRQHLFAETALELRYRFYFDDWAVLAHTAEAQLHLGWTPAFGLRLRYRLHHQGGASFWEDVYSEPRRYVTADRELSPLTGHLAGLLVFGRFERVGGIAAIEPYAKVDLFRYDYHDFHLLNARQGLVGEVGLEIEF